MSKFLLYSLVTGLFLQACQAAAPSPPTLAPPATVTATSTEPPPLTATIPAATGTPAATMPPTSTLVDGWLVYVNAIHGYDFSYPPAAQLKAEGVNGYSPDEVPVDFKGDYFEVLTQKYPGDLCVGLRYQMGFITIQVPWEKGGKYSTPCGVSGVGDYDLVKKAETVLIGETPYVADGYQVYERDAARTFRSEFFFVQLEDGTGINYGGFWTNQGAAYDDYVPVKRVLLQILATYRQH